VNLGFKKLNKKISVKNRRLGNVQIIMDAEDANLISDYSLEIKHLDNPARNPIIIARPKGSKVSKDYLHLSRMILDEHNALDVTHNVFYKTNSYDLRKKNLVQGTSKF